MKFSDAGIEKICDLMVATYDGLESRYDNPRGLASQLEKYEFEPNDFDGMVWLTAKEARRIFRYCVTRTTAIDYDAERDLLNQFHKKIERAEKELGNKEATKKAINLRYAPAL